MSASHFCCTHPQQRIDSPEPPSRPLANIDGIFAAAALPEDHPHALRLPDRKPGTDPGIVKSPGIASKIKMQFRRRSVKNLSKEKEYDGDAQRITSQEVLHEVSPKHEDDNGSMQQHRFGSVMDLRSTASPASDAGTPQVRTSVLSSLGYLRPLIEKPSDLTVSDKPHDVIDIAIRFATRQHLVGTSSENDRPLPLLPKSFSSPMLPSGFSPTTLQPRRSRSDYELGGTLHVPRSRHSQSNSRTDSAEVKQTSALNSTSEPCGLPILHFQEPTDIESGDIGQPPSDITAPSSIPAEGSVALANGVPLHNMDISQQLRCMSQLSDVAEDEPYVGSPNPWNFHRRERSDFEPSGRSRHSTQKSSTGVDSATLPSSWGRVRTPIRDTSSSIYSRPTSAGANGLDQNYPAIPDPKEMEQAIDLNSLFADWPLKPSQSTEGIYRKLSTVSQKSAASEHRNKPLPPTPNDSRQQSSTASFVTAANNNEGSSIKWRSPRQHSLTSKKSSSTLERASKASRLLERYSPPKKLVKKRRSIFKFLRPASRRQQGRSVSTPVLSTKSPGRQDTYDGPSDDPALLTVQYELSNQSSGAVRSMSMSHLIQHKHDDPSHQLLSPSHPHRRPSMAEYERKLSIVGDDRRRPSFVSHQRIQKIHEEDHRESISLRRRLSRAHALKDDASPLMAQALEKHQQEKALFRSASKQRESLRSSRSAIVSGSALIAQEGSDLQASSIEELDDNLDSLEMPHAAHASRRKTLSTGFLAPQLPTATSSRRASTVAMEPSPSVKPAQDNTRQSDPAQNPRIGTSLDSWSRYPSHTRAERCGSAGPPDSVITRDFAVDINPEEIQVTDEIEPASSPLSKKSEKARVKNNKVSLPKSRSMTFSSIVRYYSNMFHTSGFAGRNRRTSVSTGGRLDYPELEMLPPPSVEGAAHRRHSHWDPFERLKEDAQIIKDFVKEEEDKFGGYMKKEQDKLEHFVREEEDKLEGFMREEELQFEDFVKKEEHKLKAYVQDEEEKLLHHRRHHSADQNSSGRSSPFRELSVFGSNPDHSQDHRTRRDTMIGPTDAVEKAAQPVSDSERTDIGLALDGTPSTTTQLVSSMPSKADLWSGIYQECILATPAPIIRVEEDAISRPTWHESEATILPPPALRPLKPRSPEQPKQMDPKATIRRFPSVTVIDDRKGHFRSVSLISVKTSKSATFERSSTHDLLQLVQAREREERDKLLKAVNISATVETADVN